MTQEAIVLTDQSFEAALTHEKPLLILVTNGDGLRGDFATAFKKAEQEVHDMIIARLDPDKNPKAKAFFDITSNSPMLVGYYVGEEVVRRNKPWGTDLPLALEKIRIKVADMNPTVIEDVALSPEGEKALMDTKPVNVTDATFQKEVIDYELPVLVDFWADWCGPCKMVAPILEKLAAEFAGKVRIAKVDTDANPALSSNFQIRSIPTIMMIKNRTIVFNQPGALPESAFRDLLNQLIELEVPNPAQQPGPESN